MKALSFLTISLLSLLVIPVQVQCQGRKQSKHENPRLWTSNHGARSEAGNEKIKFSLHEVGIRAHYYRPDFPPLSKQFIVRTHFMRTYEFDAFYLRSFNTGLFLRGAAGMNVYGRVGNRYRSRFIIPPNYEVESSGVAKTGYLRIGAGMRLQPSKTLTILAGGEARLNAGLPFTMKGSTAGYDAGGQLIDYSYSRDRLSGGHAFGFYAFTRISVRLLKRFEAGTEFAIGVQMERGTRKREGDYFSSSNGIIFQDAEYPVKNDFAVLEMLPRVHIGYRFFSDNLR